MSESRGRSIGDVFKFVLIALLIVTPIRFFVAQPFIVTGASMTPTIDPKEYLVIDQLTYRFQKPERGDVIIFRYPLDPAVYFVKRIIGLPGEAVEIRQGQITIVGTDGARHLLPEPYIGSDPFSETNTTRLEAGEYFVMGDNRKASSDSRVWGPLQERYIIGRAAARLYPLDEFGFFPGKYIFSSQ